MNLQAGAGKGICSVQYGVGMIENCSFWGMQYSQFNSSKNNGSRNVFSVVYLKPEIQLESNGENSWHIK